MGIRGDLNLGFMASLQDAGCLWGTTHPRVAPWAIVALSLRDMGIQIGVVAAHPWRGGTAPRMWHPANSLNLH